MEQGRVQWIFPPSLALSLSPFDVLDGVAALVDQSLLRQDETPAGEARFWMLATIREFALEQLVAGGEHDRVRCEHAAYYLALAEQVQPLLSGRQSKTLLNRVEAEHDNIRAALRWADACGDTETLLRLAAALAEFWRLRGYLSEGSGWLATALARDAERGEPSSRAVAFARVEALGGAGVLARDQGNFVAARRLLEEGLALRRRFGDKQDVARGLNDLGRVLTYLADYPAANAALEESLATWRAMDDTAGVVALLWCLGDLADYEADYPRARRYDEELLSLVRGTENPLTLGTALMIFGILRARRKISVSIALG